MKTILLNSILLTAIISNAFAGHVSTALSLRMFDGRPISVMVDGVPQGTVASQHEILNLTPGIHRLKVYAAQPRVFGWAHSNMVQVFRGSIQVYSGYATYALIDRFNNLVVEDYESLLPPPPVFQGPGHLPGYSPYSNMPSQSGNVNGFNTTACSDDNGGWNNYPGHDFNRAMNQNDFNQLLSVIRSKSFESTKEDIAMGAIADNYFTSEQVRQLLNVFTFESTKLDLAKRAYGKVVDQERFYIVYDSFTFESSINSLQASIR